MRILLVQSPVGRPEAPIYPIGLAYLAGSLKNHSIKGLDLSLSADPAEDLRNALEEFSPEVVAVSLRNIDDSAYPETFWYLDSFGLIMDTLKDWKGFVITGGAGFSIYAEKILQIWDRIDLGLRGEGENCMQSIISWISGGEKPYWINGRFAQPPRPDLKDVPSPDYSLFPACDYPGKGAVGVQTRRGCVFNCAYCTYKTISGKGFRLRPVEDVVNDIIQIKKQGFDSFMFVDSVFDHPVKYFNELVDAIAKIDDPPVWEAWLSESVPLDSLSKMSRAGCKWVDFSPDVISRKGWKLMGKGGDIRKLWPAVKAAREAGMVVGVNFFSATPGENFVALVRKFLFMMRARLQLGWNSTFINIGTIRLYKGSSLAGKLHPGEELFEPIFYKPAGAADLLIKAFQRLRKLRRS
ncbi:hypothetical protein CSA37_06270 [Candidatus Fermentibacteria bacterium]|nr:MAG: hypothetical protein CSA37_06270 [Candidatus Fermentibacteria bacterium]